MENKISKEEVIDKLISVLGYGISLRAILDICYETGADAGAEEAAGCGRRDLRKAFQSRIDVIMQSRRLMDLTAGEESPIKMDANRVHFLTMPVAEKQPLKQSLEDSIYAKLAKQFNRS
jgi:hypothetical protein